MPIISLLRALSVALLVALGPVGGVQAVLADAETQALCRMGQELNVSWRNPWQNPCNWTAPCQDAPGIYCQNSRVIQLSFKELDTQLLSTIPACIGALTEILILDMSWRKLVGTIPETIANLTKLQTLRMNNNRISGTLPNFVAGMMDIQQLDLNTNRISGTIPDSWDYKYHLDTLDLSHNRLSGTIPPSMGRLMNVHYLSVDANNISGVIPGDLCTLSQENTITLCGGGADPCTVDCEFRGFPACPRCCSLALPGTADGWGSCSPVARNGSTCALRCPPGHTAVTGTCGTGTGTWTTTPSCAADPCALELPATASGWGTCANATPSGANCSLACLGGHTPRPGLCRTGSWLAVPACAADPCDLALPATASGGSNCSVLCSAGHSPVAGACANGQWATGAPACAADDCAIAALPEGAEAWGSCSHAVSSGRSCALLCRAGSVAVEGSCRDGGWAPAPVCTANATAARGRCALELPRAATGWGTCNGSVASGALCSLECAAGHVHTPGTCADGSWAPAPSCGAADAAESASSALLASVVAAGGALAMPADAESRALCTLSHQMGVSCWGSGMDHPCNWTRPCQVSFDGFLCTDSHITALYFNRIDARVHSTIPACLGAFTELTTLGMDQHRLVGTIPEALGNLTKLQTLLLNNNNLSGTIPHILAGMSHMTYVNLGHNQLSGTIPDDFDGKYFLEQLDLSHNRLSGTMPPSMGQHLVNLRTLSLANNNISGVVPQAVCSLGLYSDSPVCGGGSDPCTVDCEPGAVPSCPRCCSLVLPGTADGWGSCSPVARNGSTCALRCPPGHTAFTGTGSNCSLLCSAGHSPVAGACANGQWAAGAPACAADDCAIAALPEGAEAWGSCSHAVSSGRSCALLCRAGSVAVEGSCRDGGWAPAPVCTANATAARGRCALELPRAATGWGTCNGSVASGALCSLECAAGHVHTPGTCADGSWAPAPSCGAADAAESASSALLASVVAAGGALAMPADAESRALCTLSHEMGVSCWGSGMDHPCNWTRPCQVSFDGFLCTDSHITALYFNRIDARVHSTIPACLGAFTELTTLGMDQHRLVGTIPEALGNLTKLQTLLLNNNNLSGTIPHILAGMSHMTYVNLGHNQLSGTIPDDFDGKYFLEQLDLSHNRLSGTMPPSMGQHLVNLRTLSLANNNISGVVPQAVCSLGLYSDSPVCGGGSDPCTVDCEPGAVPSCPRCCSLALPGTADGWGSCSPVARNGSTCTLRCPPGHTAVTGTCYGAGHVLSPAADWGTCHREVSSGSWCVFVCPGGYERVQGSCAKGSWEQRPSCERSATSCTVDGEITGSDAREHSSVQDAPLATVLEQEPQATAPLGGKRAQASAAHEGWGDHEPALQAPVVALWPLLHSRAHWTPLATVAEHEPHPEALAGFARSQGSGTQAGEGDHCPSTQEPGRDE
eukprot:m51a1_g14149 putative polygalacturonase inhibiting protein 1 (1425) ;mRNA; f:22867-31837